MSNTRWFKYDRDKLWLVYTQIVPVIFEPPCSCASFALNASEWYALAYGSARGNGRQSRTVYQTYHLIRNLPYHTTIPFTRTHRINIKALRPEIRPIKNTAATTDSTAGVCFVYVFLSISTKTRTAVTSCSHFPTHYEWNTFVLLR